MKAEDLIDKDLSIGLYLCTKGHCHLMVNGTHCHIEYGKMLVKSPLVQISIIDGSHDFEFIAILEDYIEHIAPVASDNIDIILNLLRLNKYDCILEQEEINFLLQRKNHIDKHKNEIAHGGISLRQQKLIRDIIVMLERTTILEYAKILFDKSIVTSDEIKKTDDIFIHFALMLFQYYRKSREVAFYADAFKISPNHFTRIIKKASGHTPSEWIIFVTVNHAKRLLQQPNVRIKDVAQALCFPEQFTFHKYFKQHAGVSPKEYQKSCKLAK